VPNPILPVEENTPVNGFHDRRVEGVQFHGALGGHRLSGRSDWLDTKVSGKRTNRKFNVWRGNNMAILAKGVPQR